MPASESILEIVNESVGNGLKADQLGRCKPISYTEHCSPQGERGPKGTQGEKGAKGQEGPPGEQVQIIFSCFYVQLQYNVVMSKIYCSI